MILSTSRAVGTYQQDAPNAHNAPNSKWKNLLFDPIGLLTLVFGGGIVFGLLYWSEADVTFGNLDQSSGPIGRLVRICFCFQSILVGFSEIVTGLPLGLPIVEAELTPNNGV